MSSNIPTDLPAKPAAAKAFRCFLTGIFREKRCLSPFRLARCTVPVIGSTGFFAPVRKPQVSRPAIGGSKPCVGRTRGLSSGTVLVCSARCGPLDLNNRPIMLSFPRAKEESRTEGLQAGADDDWGKPLPAREVTARVSTHLKHSKLKKSLSSVSVKSGQDHFSLITY